MSSLQRNDEYLSDGYANYSHLITIECISIPKHRIVPHKSLQLCVSQK
jgi:hypothetical protein